MHFQPMGLFSAEQIHLLGLVVVHPQPQTRRRIDLDTIDIEAHQPTKEHCESLPFVADCAGHPLPLALVVQQVCDAEAQAPSVGAHR